MATGIVNRLRPAIDPNGNPLMDCCEVSGYIDNRVLAANTHEDHTIPTGAKVVRITCSAAMWVNFVGEATIPTDEVSTGLGCIYIPVERFFALPIDATVISMISGSTCLVSLEFSK